MLRLKSILKNVLSRVACVALWKSKVSVEEARISLQYYSPKPSGDCKADNVLKADFDLQVIIPAYNVEKYIQQCLDSVFSQVSKYKTVVTIVNDGSTDRTESILSNLPSKIGDGMAVEVITQKNKGIYGARNTALQIIKGEYVTFLDSDDVLVDGAIQKMMDVAFASNADIVQGSWYTFCKDNRTNHIISKDGVVDDNRGVFSGFPWGKLFKNTVVEHFQFPEGFWFEDTPISFILAAMPYRCVAIKDIVYGYRLNPEGITATAAFNKKSIDSYWITEECLIEFPHFGLSYDQRAYEYLLRQSLMNEGRARHQPRRIREAEFVLTSNLMEIYFAGFETKDRMMKKIEYALRKRQFIKFELLAMSM